MLKIKKSSKKITLLISVALLLAMSVAGATYIQRRNNSEQAAPSPSPQLTINYNPPTPEDAQRVEDNKQKIITQEKAQATQPATQTGRKTVTPLITYAGQYGESIEVGAGVNGIFEDNGQCTATFTKGARVITKRVTAAKNSNAVDCPVMSVTVPELAEKGSWSLVVSYDSASSYGISDSRQIEVN